MQLHFGITAFWKKEADTITHLLVALRLVAADCLQSQLGLFPGLSEL